MIRASGQWWDAGYQHFDVELAAVGISTLERLQQCYVFSGGYIAKDCLDIQNVENLPDYWEYEAELRGQDANGNRVD